MKKDNLERFVRDNREAFDDAEPPMGLWSKIESGLGGPGLADPIGNERDDTLSGRVVPLNGNAARGAGGWFNLNWRVAASIAVLLLAGTLLYKNYQPKTAAPSELVAAGPAYAQQVAHYTQLIDNKRAELKQMTGSNPALYEQFSADLDRLEHSYQGLKAELPQNPNQEVLIQAMIQNLQLQINLLNEQLRVIERIKHQNQKANENVV
ncbi:hypothetical protein [Fibrisoma montanum]|nr:hypothetical protein [Fibrisoma montanum]